MNNLCFPESGKSCAACCGLYNVPNGRREALHARLSEHTERFGRFGRRPTDLVRYETETRERERIVPLDEIIHVCEFVGFVDAEHRRPGCLLHPFSPGNDGIDLRGMCHYGRLACTTFYCSAFSELGEKERIVLDEIIDDWHLWGLAAVDLDFVRALFGVVESTVGPIEIRDYSVKTAVGTVLRKLVSWKANPPGPCPSAQRRSLYYHKGVDHPDAANRAYWADVFVRRIVAGMGDAVSSEAVRDALARELKVLEDLRRPRRTGECRIANEYQ